MRSTVRKSADVASAKGDLLVVAVAAGATVGEICGVLRSVWGEYRPSTVF